MESNLIKSSVNGGFLVKEEKKAESFSGEEEDCFEEIGYKIGKGRREQNADGQKDLTSGKQDNRLKSVKAEMGEVIEENQRLRMYLEEIMEDYRNLQKQFDDIVQQEAANKPSRTITTHQEAEEPELISLSLGRTLSSEIMKKEDAIKNLSNEKFDDHEDHDKEEDLALGLDCKFEMPKNVAQKEVSPNPSHEASSEEVKDEAGETWPPQKGLKTVRAGDDEVSQASPAKRARVSVRVRCDTPTMNDGCQWRKYGQKIAKGNPCPRAYYRCTVAPNCPVRKQVQRCAEDMSILITTYEGTHNHPLPISATAMASTTSAAAQMLMSGSTTSGSGASSSTPSLTSNSLNGPNFYLSDNSRGKPFYIPNSSISSLPSFPTITLDLTTNSNSTSSHINKLGIFPPRYSTTNLNFSSLESSAAAIPMSWSNEVRNYGTQIAQPYYKNQMCSFNFARQSQETAYNNQSNLQKHILNSSQQQALPAETIAAATKAITSDPSFQSALAAALTSIIGSGASNNNNGGNVGIQVAAAGDKLLDQNLKLCESFPVLSSFPSTSTVTKCASSFLNKSTANSQLGNLTFISPNSLPFSSPTSKSSSPNRDHIS